ncbi:hypothetical protein VTK56DRAFT_9196 [Thermocarpiscus australiensis]
MGNAEKADTEKPILLVAAFSAPGHTYGLIQVSEYLVRKGFKIYFIAGSDYKRSIEKAGAEFIENPWRWEEEHRTVPPPGIDELTWHIKHVFADATPVAFRTLKHTLERLRREHPTREIIIIHETFSMGLAPFYYGAPLPEGYSSLPKVISFHTSVNGGKEYSRPPFGPGLPYDPTPENLAVWRSIYDAVDQLSVDINAYFNDIYKSLGATRPMTGWIFDNMVTLGEVTLMATSPGLEYPVRHNPKLRFIGGLPLKPLDPAFAYPPWWPTITANAALPRSSPDRKKVVFVTQGTVHREYSEIIIPAMKGLAGRSDLIVVVTLGSRGAELPADVEVHENTRVTDYLPYDALLPYADVFISNAGYGGFMHGVMNGVPMVLAGTKADKAEVCARAEWAGLAVNLRTQAPSVEALRDAVDKVLGDEKYKQRALELKRENEELNALGKFEAIIEELAGAK